MSYPADLPPAASAPAWTRLQPACAPGWPDATQATAAGGVLEIVDASGGCDHAYYRADPIEPADDAVLEWRVLVSAASHPAAVSAGLLDGVKAAYVGHEPSQAGLLTQDPVSGANTYLRAPVALAAGAYHTYRLVKRGTATVELHVDGALAQAVAYAALPDYVDPVRVEFFGAGSNQAMSISTWDHVRYTIAPAP